MDQELQREELTVLQSIYLDELQELTDGCLINLPIDCNTTIHNIHADMTQNKSKNCDMEVLLVVKFLFPSNYPSSALPIVQLSITKCQPKNQKTNSKDETKLSAIANDLTEKFSRFVNDQISRMNAGEMAVFNIIEAIRSYAAELHYEYRNEVDLPLPPKDNLKKSAERSLWDEMMSRYTGFENISLQNCGTLIVFPNEIMLYIMSFLDAKSAATVARSCKTLHKFVVNDSFWKVAYSNRFPTGDYWHQSMENKPSFGTSWKERYITRQQTIEAIESIPKTKVKVFLLTKSNGLADSVSYDLQKKKHFPTTPAPHTNSNEATEKLCMDEDVILCSEGNQVSVWDFKMKSYLLTQELNYAIRSMQLRMNDLLIATPKGLHICDKWTAFPSQTILPDKSFWDARWTSKNIIAVHSGGVLVLDITTQQILHQEKSTVMDENPHAICVSPDGNVVYHGHNNKVELLDIRSNRTENYMTLNYPCQTQIEVWNNNIVSLAQGTIYNHCPYDYPYAFSVAQASSCMQLYNNDLYFNDTCVRPQWKYYVDIANAPHTWSHWVLLKKWAAKRGHQELMCCEELPLRPIRAFRISDAGVLMHTESAQTYFMSFDNSRTT